MEKVFNMGHRMEIYVSPSEAEAVVALARSMGVEAQVIGHVEDHPEGNKLTILRSDLE